MNAAAAEAKHWARSAQMRREKLIAARKLTCLCGAAKGATHVVCPACFKSAPLAMQVNAYSRVPAIARTAIRQLLSRAASQAAERQLETPRAKPGTHFPGGELTQRSAAEIQAAAEHPRARRVVPAPAGESLP